MTSGISVRARLDRDGSVYLAGEKVSCTLQLHNRSDKYTDTIAWCSAQIHCQSVINASRVRQVALTAAPSLNVPTGRAQTSFVPTKGENGNTVYASKPIVLFCELTLQPNETKTVTYTETLPEDDCAPSHRGHSVKYTYKVTLGIQHANEPVHMMRIPFRLITIGTTAANVGRLVREQHQQQNELSPANPFLADNQHQLSILEMVNEIIENVTAGKQKHSYNVTWSGGSVCQVTMYKSAYKLGDCVTVDMNFDECNVPCVQVCVSLQSVEHINDEYGVKSDQPPYIITHSRAHSICLYHKNETLALDIPFTATPTFYTDILHHKWRLYFEFVTAKDGADAAKTRLNWPIDQPSNEAKTSQHDEWCAPDALPVETMIWQLPIKVFPCNPLNICLTSPYAQQQYVELVLPASNS